MSMYTHKYYFITHTNTNTNTHTHTQAKLEKIAMVIPEGKSTRDERFAR